MHPSLVPPRFEVNDVRGDGNCFYYAVLSSLNRFRYRESAKDASELKKLLLDFLQTSKFKHSWDRLMIKRTARRLQEPYAWADQEEIRLTADLLDVCIFVFKPIYNRQKREQHWSLTSYVPSKFEDICGYSGRVFTAEEILEAYFCQDHTLCGPNTIFLLNVHDNHYMPLRRLRRSEYRSESRTESRAQPPPHRSEPLRHSLKHPSRRDCKSHHGQDSCDSDANCMWLPAAHLQNFASHIKKGMCSDIRHLLR